MCCWQVDVSALFNSMVEEMSDPVDRAFWTDGAVDEVCHPLLCVLEQPPPTVPTVTASFLMVVAYRALKGPPCQPRKSMSWEMLPRTRTPRTQTPSTAACSCSKKVPRFATRCPVLVSCASSRHMVVVVGGFQASYTKLCKRLRLLCTSSQTTVMPGACLAFAMPRMTKIPRPFFALVRGGGACCCRWTGCSLTLAKHRSVPVSRTSRGGGSVQP